MKLLLLDKNNNILFDWTDTEKYIVNDSIEFDWTTDATVLRLKNDYATLWKWIKVEVEDWELIYKES